jgi:hypothetical protein
MSTAAIAPAGSAGSISAVELDTILAAQFMVAWAGETGERDSARLGWWRSDLASEFGGEALFQRLVPQTWRWAAFQAAREAARRTDVVLRNKEHDPDDMVSLYNLGFTLDERLDERLREHKLSGSSPTEMLPVLAEVVAPGWSREGFVAWVRRHGASEFTRTTAGRRLKGAVPDGLDEILRRLVGALEPVGDAYPLPHFRRSP